MPKLPEPEQSIEPYWSTPDGRHIRLYHGNVTDVLARLPEKSVHCVVTSPPYWGLRDYKAGSDEIGQERTPDEFVARMVEVFRGVRRVLRDDGTVWLNLGDSYNGSGGSGGRGKQDTNRVGKPDNRSGSPTLPQGNLIGIPWRAALALQADGWILRQDIIWAKPAPMPESVRNRCTKAHEYVFLFAKSNQYFYDAEAIKEKSSYADDSRAGHGRLTYDGKRQGEPGTGNEAFVTITDTKNKRSVWTVNSPGYEGAHFATFPPKLIEPMIKAGTSEKGCCAKCVAPWRRVVEEKRLTRERPNDYVKRTGEDGTGNSCANSVAGVDAKTIGWEPTCACKSGVVPCTVLDPFIGSGTTCDVSIELGRASVGIDLSEKYLKNNAIPRIEGALLRRVDTAKLIERKRTAFKSNGGKLGILKR